MDPTPKPRATFLTLFKRYPKTIPIVAQFANMPKQNERTNGYTVRPDGFGAHRYTLFIVSILIVALSIFIILTIRRHAGGNADKPLAKVGAETLYEKDLDVELRYFPQQNAAAKKTLLAKMVKDSLILQGANKDRLIALDENVFNNADKDYLKRMQVVDSAKQAVEKQAQRIKGTVVAIWFYNEKVGKLGYEQSKEISRFKINRLQQLVKNKLLTIKQAAQQIKDDTSLADIDEVYKLNATFDFDKTSADPITFDETFNKVLWDLQLGEVSDLFLLKDTPPDSSTPIDSVYMFGQISEKTANTGITNFDMWYAQQQSQYQVIYY